MNSPIIETNRTVLTILRPEQAYLIHEYYLKNREHLKVWEPIRNETFYTLKEWEKRVSATWQDYGEKRAVCFAALDKSGFGGIPVTKENILKAKFPMIAGCNFRNIVHGCFQACHLGFSVDADFQGKGIMQEVCNAGIDYMFKKIGLHRIMANHLPYNHRSEKLLKKLGFEKEGYARDYLKINGKWQDHVLTALINR